MKIQPIKRTMLSLVSVALVSGILWMLAEGKPDAWLAILAVISIILTSGIWFLLAWQLYDTKLSVALPSYAIALAPYAILVGLDRYMLPYTNNDGGNAWAWILDSYGNILFNPAYHFLSSLSVEGIATAATGILLLQILLPFVLALLIRFLEKNLGKKGNML